MHESFIDATTSSAWADGALPTVGMRWFLFTNTAAATRRVRPS